MLVQFKRLNILSIIIAMIYCAKDFELFITILNKMKNCKNTFITNIFLFFIKDPLMLLHKASN